jgi:hypothetical protein
LYKRIFYSTKIITSLKQHTMPPIALDLLAHGGILIEKFLTHATFLEPMRSGTSLPPSLLSFPAIPASLDDVMQDIQHMLLPPKPFVDAIPRTLHEEWRKGVRSVIGLCALIVSGRWEVVCCHALMV